MAIDVQSPPPPVRVHPIGREPWTELVEVRDPVEADYLLSRLSREGIPTRVLASGDGARSGSCRYLKGRLAVIYVQLAQLEEARFALVRAAYDAPPAAHAPFAEKGTRHYLRTFAWVPALVLSAALMVGAAFLDAESPRGCQPTDAPAWRVGRTVGPGCHVGDREAGPTVSDRTGARARMTPPRMAPAAP